MATLKITKNNGTVIQLPEPETLSVGIQDLDSEKSGRNQKGEMFRDRIAVKRKLNIKFLPLSSDDMKKVLNAVSDKFFTIEYPDPMTGAKKSITAYVGDRTAPVYIIKNGTPMWDEMTLSIVER